MDGAVADAVCHCRLLPVSKRIAPRYMAVREQVSILNSYLSNNLGGIATIKSYTTEQYELQQIERESQIYQQKNQHAIALSAAFVPIIRMVIALGFSAILVAAGLMAADGNLTLAHTAFWYS